MLEFPMAKATSLRREKESLLPLVSVVAVVASSLVLIGRGGLAVFMGMPVIVVTGMPSERVGDGVLLSEGESMFTSVQPGCRE
jgi:hypothetical protein